MTDSDDEKWMNRALREAEAAAARGEVPIGAVLVDEKGKILAADGNRTLEMKDPTAHAEMLVIREAARLLDNERLIDTTLYVTLEPCAMCAGAISFARIKRLIFAANDEKGGSVVHGAKFFDLPTCHHRPTVENGTASETASELLRSFFAERREGLRERRKERKEKGPG